MKTIAKIILLSLLLGCEPKVKISRINYFRTIKLIEANSKEIEKKNKLLINNIKKRSESDENFRIVLKPIMPKLEDIDLMTEEISKVIKDNIEENNSGLSNFPKLLDGYQKSILRHLNKADQQTFLKEVANYNYYQINTNAISNNEERLLILKVIYSEIQIVSNIAINLMINSIGTIDYKF